MNMNTAVGKTISDTAIRHTYAEDRKQWYFSVVDVVGLITNSSDPRNYWKVTKSRFYKTNPQLVTECIQLKLPSGDGKSYATDTAGAETLLGIIELISSIDVPLFRRWFDDIEYSHTKDIHRYDPGETAELQIDLYETPHALFIKSLIPGVHPSDITVSATHKMVSIYGTRIRTSTESIFYQQELYWGSFNRNIALPYEIILDEITANISHGILTITIPLVDRQRTRVIKIKSL